MTLGQRIQQIRVTHGLSQEEFGEKLDTTRQTVSRWELDQSQPELAKIVLISKLFSVTTDSMLRDGISTFDGAIESFSCGIYRSPSAEIVETEKFSLVYYCNADKSILGTKLYFGYKTKKRLVAICERDQTHQITHYAYTTEEGTTVTNDAAITHLLGERYDPSPTKTMHRPEHFLVDHSGNSLPRVSEAGIPRCLSLWRKGDSYRAIPDSLFFSLCTDRREYIFSIDVTDDNVYCGISYNTVFDLGLFCRDQFFRIRNYKDNTAPFCRFFCDFSHEWKDIKIPTDQCEIGKSQQTGSGIMMCVKRYTEEEIVLAGCGGDEYTYSRNEIKSERFTEA